MVESSFITSVIKNIRKTIFQIIALMKLLQQTVEEKIGKSEALVASDFLGDLIAHLGDSVPPLEKHRPKKIWKKFRRNTSS